MNAPADSSAGTATEPQDPTDPEQAADTVPDLTPWLPVPAPASERSPIRSIPQWVLSLSAVILIPD